MDYAKIALCIFLKEDMALNVYEIHLSSCISPLPIRMDFFEILLSGVSKHSVPSVNKTTSFIFSNRVRQKVTGKGYDKFRWEKYLAQQNQFITDK